MLISVIVGCVIIWNHLLCRIRFFPWGVIFFVWVQWHVNILCGFCSVSRESVHFFSIMKSPSIMEANKVTLNLLVMFMPHNQQKNSRSIWKNVSDLFEPSNAGNLDHHNTNEWDEPNCVVLVHLTNSRTSRISIDMKGQHTHFKNYILRSTLAAPFTSSEVVSYLSLPYTSFH